jgi:hypothetical protein
VLSPSQGGRAQAGKTPAKRGAEIVQHGGYPELRVDGQPFFLHSAALFYSRIPRDLWESSLDRYRELGINTIDLYIIWNWHEPREGELDFDGHTNPRRDLRGLLQLIARKGFKLIARPGPTVLNEWRNGGYPAWLLERKEYAMPLADRLEGRYPPLSVLNAQNAEAAAQGWLENQTHMHYARRWLIAVGKELAPYRNGASLTVPAEMGKKGKNIEEREISGPLLFVQVEDDLAIGRANYAGPGFWKYVDTLRRALEEGGLNVPCFINPDHPRVAAAGSALERPIGAMGQWYLAPSDAEGLGERRLRPGDVTALGSAVQALQTQPAFPPMLIEYNAGWYAPGDDARPQPSPPANTLLSTRLLIANGVHGLNYFPLQDTLFPAGFETPWTNRDYRWDAALTLNASRQPRAQAVNRTGQWLGAWGSFVAATHKRADFGLVYLMGALAQQKLLPEDIQAISSAAEKIERLAQYAGLSAELVDPQYQPAEQLLRHALLLLPVLRPEDPKYTFSEKAQRALVAYVRGGGTLVCFPALPAGAVFEELWSMRPAHPETLPDGTKAWHVGAGRVAVLTKDFYNWVWVGEDFPAGRARFEAAYAISQMGSFLSEFGLRPSIGRAWQTPASAWLVATQLVTNEGTLPLGARTGGQGLLSVTNLSYDSRVSESLELLSPRASALGSMNAGVDRLSLQLNLPPRESLLLPLEFPLCAEPADGNTCKDAIVAAGAELVRAERDDKIMILSFCVPARATLRLRLAERPGRVELDETHQDAPWDELSHELALEIPRGASPNFLRVLRIRLPYKPSLPQRPRADLDRHPKNWSRHSATGGVRLPLGNDTSVISNPPLFALEKSQDARLLVTVENLDTVFHEAQLRLAGAFEAAVSRQIPGGEFRTLALMVPAAKVEKAAAMPPGPDGLLRGTLRFGAGSEGDEQAVFFAMVPEKGSIGYHFDLDGDGSDEWVLESTGLRAIFSPAAGGRAVGLVDKVSGVNLASTAGLLEDAFAFSPNPPGERGDRMRGRSGTFNRPYAAAWLPEATGPALAMSYEAPDVYPHGARIEKTVRLSDDNRIAVQYRVTLAQAGEKRLEEEAAGRIFAARPPAQPVPQSFVILNSIPAEAAEGRSTRFCWRQAPSGAAGGAPAEHCEVFAAGGEPLALPAGVTRLEVRTPAKPRLAVDWRGAGAGAEVLLEQKRYTVLLRLSCPPLDPGGAAGAYGIEFTVSETP